MSVEVRYKIAESSTRNAKPVFEMVNEYVTNNLALKAADFCRTLAKALTTVIHQNMNI